MSADQTVHPRPNRRVEIDTDKMRAARQQHGWSYTTLAEWIRRMGHDVSSARLGQIEAGKGSPSPELFPLLARALGVPENELRRAA